MILPPEQQNRSYNLNINQANGVVVSGTNFHTHTENPSFQCLLIMSVTKLKPNNSPTANAKNNETVLVSNSPI